MPQVSSTRRAGLPAGALPPVPLGELRAPPTCWEALRAGVAAAQAGARGDAGSAMRSALRSARAPPGALACEDALVCLLVLSVCLGLESWGR
jgi:hypothetical protein